MPSTARTAFVRKSLAAFILAGAALLPSFGLSRQAEAQMITRFGSLLVAVGTDSHDDIYVYERQMYGWYDYANGVYHPGGTYLAVWMMENSGRTHFYQVEKRLISSISVNADAGDDYVSITTDLDSWINAGTGEDTVHGGEGNDIIYAGGTYAADFMYGHGGRDTIHAGYNRSGRSFVPYAIMYGGSGLDTYIYNNADRIVDTNINGQGWFIQADFTFNSGPNAGMHQVSE